MSAPIEVEFPDLGPWREGNAGIPHLWTFEGARAGPHVALQALTHGNEVCGAVVLDALLREQARPVRGRLSLCFANVAAYARWDPATPFASRCVDEDFNRLWSDEVLRSARASSELVRARELRPFYDGVDYLLDIHSMSEACPPLMMTGVQRKSIELARALAYPEHIVVDAGHAAGRRLRDYAFFDDPTDPRTALLVECGQHWEAKSVGVARQCALRFLRHFDVLDGAWIDERIERVREVAQRVIEVTHSIPIRTPEFAWVRPVGALEVIPAAGTLLATDGEERLTTPYADCVLIMPMQRAAKVGETAVRLGRYVA